MNVPGLTLTGLTTLGVNEMMNTDEMTRTQSSGPAVLPRSRNRTLWLLPLIAVLVCLSFLVSGGAVAQADTGFIKVGQFGSEVAGTGQQLQGPVGVAVDRSSGSAGDVYVTDSQNNRVEKFGPSGLFLAAWGWGVSNGAAESQVCTTGCQAGIAGSENGQFSTPTGVAVDPVSGDVYVFNAGDGLVEKFSAAGVFVAPQFGGLGSGNGTFASEDSGSNLAVDSSGDVYVADSGNHVVQKFTSAGVFLPPMIGEGVLSSPKGVAVDSSGNVYVADGSNRNVQKFNSSGLAVSTLDGGGSELPRGVSVDASNNVFVLAFNLSAFRTQIVEYDPSGTPLAEALTTTLTTSVGLAFGIAASATAGQVYVAAELYNDVVIFDQVTLPHAVTGLAENAQATSATVTGTVNPESSEPAYAASYHFQYGTDTTYSAGSVPVPDTQVGSGTSDVPASANLTNLQPNKTYHYRLVASNQYGSSYGADAEFTTPPEAPLVQQESATNVSQTNATLNAQINPNNQDTQYYFQYGTDTGYALGELPAPYPPGTDIGEAFGLQPVSANIEELSGTPLTRNTIYHFRAVAVNPTGTTYGPDQTVTTLPPAPMTGAASGVTDSAATLTGTFNPGGIETSYYFNYGTDTTYSLGKTPTTAAGAGVSTLAAAATVTALQPLTTYHFQLVALNAGGPTPGPDMSFTTLPLAPGVSTDAVGSGPTVDSVILAGSVDPEGVAATYHFDYGPSSSYGQSTPAPGPELASATSGQYVTTVLGGLTPGAVYHYRLVAANTGGTTYGPDQTFTTYATAPTVTTGPAQNVGQSTAQLTGTINAQGAETTYHFQYGTTIYYSTAEPVPAVDAGSSAVDHGVIANIAGLAPSTTYHYRLVASNAGGTSYGADQAFTTAPVASLQAPALTPTPTPTKITPPPAIKPSKALTRAQKLGKALKACQKKPKKQRASCKRQARKTYGTPTKKGKGTKK
jgi:DNA-binding beta-propeller fold protein YncE